MLVVLVALVLMGERGVCRQDETRVLAETGRGKEDSEDFKKRLRKELMSRDGQK